MRMGPFSNLKIVELLNDYFVPLYVSNEDYLDTPKAAQLTSIWQDAEDRELDSGTVHVFIVNPDRTVSDSLHVAKAIKIGRMTKLLADAIRTRDLQPLDQPLVNPKPLERLPDHEADDVVLHLATDYRRHVGMVSENWIVLTPEDWKRFLPPAGIANGTSWKIATPVSKKILLHLYPYSENWDSLDSEIAECSMRAYRLPTPPSGLPRVVVRGRLSMLHNRNANGNPQRVSAEVAGIVELAAGKKPRFTISTGNAVYGSEAFDGLYTTREQAVQQNARSADNANQ